MTGLNAAINARSNNSSAVRKGRVVKAARVVIVAMRVAQPRGPMIHAVRPRTRRHPGRKAWCRLKPPNAACGSA